MRMILLFICLCFIACTSSKNNQVFVEDEMFQNEKKDYYTYANQIKKILLDKGLLLADNGDAFYGGLKYLKKYEGKTFLKLDQEVKNELVLLKNKQLDLSLGLKDMFLTSSDSELQKKWAKTLNYLKTEEVDDIEGVCVAILGHFKKEDFNSIYLQSILLIQMNEYLHDYFWDVKDKKLKHVNEDLELRQVNDIEAYGYKAKKVLTIEPISSDTLIYKSVKYAWKDFQDTLQYYNDSLLVRVYFDSHMEVENYISSRKALEYYCKSVSEKTYKRELQKKQEDALVNKEVLRKKTEISILEL